jgi:hypothetical protein
VAVSLAAPYLFTTFLEWDIGLFVAFVMAAVLLFLAMPKTGTRRDAALFVFGGGIGAYLYVVLLLLHGNLGPQSPSDPRLVDRQRNFYGVVSVWEVDDPKFPGEHRRRMKHGAIMHGQQFVSTDEAVRRRPLTYYTPDSGVGQAILKLREQRRGGPINVGLVGLGVGTLASYAEKGDHFTFYEINPVVREMAEKYFTYLSDAEKRGAKITLEMGDARLTLKRQDPQKFDLLVLDAFSGDSVPVHLLTREAMDIYRKHVAPQDVIAIHDTNQYLYLFPVVRALAEDADRDWRRIYRTQDNSIFRGRSDWVVISGNEKYLDEIPNVPPPPEQHEPDFGKFAAWTDQNNNQFRILIGEQ